MYDYVFNMYFEAACVSIQADTYTTESTYNKKKSTLINFKLNYAGIVFHKQLKLML